LPDVCDKRFTEPDGCPAVAAELNVRTVLDSLPVGVAVYLPADGRLLYANTAAVDALDAATPALPTDPCETSWTANERHFEVRARPVRWEGGPAMLASIEDITASKNTERLRGELVHADRLAALGRLAAGVAHEVNNPLAYILANLSMLQDDLQGRGAEATAQIPGDTLEMLGECIEGTKRIRALVDDLRVFSRKTPDEFETVDLDSVVDSVLNLISADARRRALIEWAPGAPPAFSGVPSTIAQVVMNLVDNAVHAIDAKQADGHRIHIATTVAAGDAVLTVTDTGCGIPDSVRSHIFEPFFTTKHRQIGTGLGLSLAREIAQLHGGRIEIESNVGEGTVVAVYFPIHRGL